MSTNAVTRFMSAIHPIYKLAMAVGTAANVHSGEYGWAAFFFCMFLECLIGD